MKNYIVFFLILTTFTGLVGFAGLDFEGVTVFRIFFIIFADLLIVSILSKFFFASDSERMRLERIRK